MRLLPTITWVGASTVVGLSIAWRQGFEVGYNTVSVSLVFLGGVLCHGLLSHSANDYIDWASGTDRLSPGLFSGGSRVVPQGHLAVRSLYGGMAVGFIGGAIVTIILLCRLGTPALTAGLLGATAAIIYSLPPFMLSYRPLVGEWLAAAPALSACSWLVCLAASNGLAVPQKEFSLIVCSAIAFVAHLMYHHLSDIEADLAATPRKLTTPAYAALKGRDPRIIPAAYWLVLLVLSYYYAHAMFIALAALCLCALQLVKLTDLKNLAYSDKVLFVLTGLFIVLEAVL